MTARLKARNTKTAAKAKTATKVKAARRKSAAGKNLAPVHVRMYNVGFGDCFLITFGTKAGPRRVLIDCGYHVSGPPPVKIAEVVTAIIQDITVAGKARIDVVIGTHRHRDHVYGFEDPRWAEVEVGEVWMPWTEDEKDEDARRVREAQSAKAKRLALAIDRLHMAGRLDAAQHAAASHVVSNSNLTNSTAMEMLHRGFKGRPLRRFVPEKPKRGAETATEGVREITSDLLSGVKVHILGPSRDNKIIRDMNPPGDESFLHLAGDADGGPAQPPFPLQDWTFLTAELADRQWMDQMAEEHAAESKAEPPATEVETPWPSRSTQEFKARWFKSLDLKPAEILAWEKDVADDAFAAAVSLEQAVNGTSLFLVFETGKQFLAFPGDAQWGTWNAALQDPEWRALLKRTTFYKVGHHGSHNATPVQFVDDVLQDGRFVAMVSTKETKNFDDIPRKPLLTELGKKAVAIARSDRKAANPFTQVDDLRTDFEVHT